MRCVLCWLRMMTAILCCGMALGFRPPQAAAQTVDKADALSQINRARILNGASPLALNAALEKAAQRHSQDMADKGFLDHIGSDGSKLDDRVLAAGYSSWIGQRVWAELVYAGDGSFAEALAFWVSDNAQKRILLDSRFREIGIGVALNTSPAGVTTAYWALVLGAQPNALPVFINDGAVVTNLPQVAIRLTQETVAPEGEGNSIGRAIEVRISADPGFAGAVWQPWEMLLPFTFDDTPGLKTIYVQYRDASDRMTVSTASIQYNPSSAPVVIAVGPGAQDGLQNTPGNTAETATAPAPVGAANQHAVQPVADATARPTPDATAAGQSLVAVVSPAPNNPPPMPTTSINAGATAQPDLTGAPAPADALSRPDATLPDWVLPGVAVAQAMVIVLGLLALLQRKHL